MTPSRLRPSAEADLVERTRYYADYAGDEVAARFFDSTIQVLRAVERMPGIGTPRVGEAADIPGLRMRRVEGFPCGWFYFVHPDHLDVVRLLADAQDLNAIVETVANAE